jgi:hypothetical protein
MPGGAFDWPNAKTMNVIQIKINHHDVLLHHKHHPKAARNHERSGARLPATASNT